MKEKRRKELSQKLHSKCFFLSALRVLYTPYEQLSRQQKFEKLKNLNKI